MNIGIVAPFIRPVCLPTTGGIETCVYLLASGLAARGHEVTLFASKESQVPGVKVVHFDIFAKDIKYALPLEALPVTQFLEVLERETLVHQNILSYIAHHSFDIVHSNTWFWVYFLITPFVARPPIVHTLYQVANYPTLVNAIRLLPDQLSTRLVAISELVKKSYIDTTELQISKVIPFGIDPDHIAPFDSSVPQRQFVWIGRIVAEKGPDVAIQVARAAGYRLALLGPVDDIYFFESSIKPQLDANMEYLGVRDWDEIRSLLLNASALLVTTRFPEGFSWVALEALAWGCPVVTTTKCGIAENRRVSEYIFELNGHAFDNLPSVLHSLRKVDRQQISLITREELPISRMIDGYEAYYAEVIRQSSESEGGVNDIRSS